MWPDSNSDRVIYLLTVFQSLPTVPGISTTLDKVFFSDFCLFFQFEIPYRADALITPKYFLFCAHIVFSHPSLPLCMWLSILGNIFLQLGITFLLISHQKNHFLCEVSLSSLGQIKGLFFYSLLTLCVNCYESIFITVYVCIYLCYIIINIMSTNVFIHHCIFCTQQSA